MSQICHGKLVNINAVRRVRCVPRLTRRWRYESMGTPVDKNETALDKQQNAEHKIHCPPLTILHKPCYMLSYVYIYLEFYKAFKNV